MFEYVLSAIGITALPILLLYVLSPVPRKPYPSEKHFINLQTDKEEQFPSILHNESEIELTVVVPAYKETKRLPNMLDKSLHYLRKHHSGNFEIIIVDDGSGDDTSECAYEYGQEKCKEIRVMTLSVNRGKGGAVTQGIMAARGKYILFADADGATDFNDLEKLLDKTRGGEYDIAIAHLVTTTAVVKRSFIRNFLMHGFHLVVLLLTSEGVRHIKDTQCGFKLFSRKAAQMIFPFMHIEGSPDDIVLHLAYLKGLRVIEVPVNWEEVDGSKMSLLRDSIKMALDLLIIKVMFALGIWRTS